MEMGTTEARDGDALVWFSAFGVTSYHVLRVSRDNNKLHPNSHFYHG